MSVEQTSYEMPGWIKPANPQVLIEPWLDDLVEQLAEERISQTEKSLLDKACWSQGQSVRLRDDNRFYQTPWGNWLLADENIFLANDWLYEQFVNGVYLQASLTKCLADATTVFGKTACFCPADSRFRCIDGDLRLDSTILSHNPRFTDDPGDGRFITYLPFYDLKVVAASEPAGEWGKRAHDHSVAEGGILESTLPAQLWIRIDLAGTQLNDTLFVSYIHGHSMDDGRRGLTDGALAVFEYWPKGSRKDKLVVVRGAFHDPETGSYALKQYQPDTRNEQGEHQEIILHSLNPDKTRYPDIHLKPERGDDLVIVAEYLRVLDESEYARKPKQAVPDGERDILNADAQKQRSKRLEEIHQQIFAEEPLAGGTNTGNDQMSDLGWVCLAGKEGGPALEIVPLKFLPTFVKKLELHYDGQVGVLLASNYRVHKRLKVISPGALNYQLQPPAAFEDDFDDEFSSWHVGGLDKATIHWFRVDASGVGRPVEGVSWSEGSTYRAVTATDMVIVVPPENITLLADGWSMIEFDLGYERPDWLLTLIGSNALTKSPPQLAWINTSPVAWEVTAKEHELAIFNSHPLPLLSIKLPNSKGSSVKPGALVLLHNGEQAETLTLTDGTEWQLRLADLQAGKYVIQVIPADKQFTTEYKPFIVKNSSALQPTCARFKLHASSRDGKVIEIEPLLKVHDWSKLEDGLDFFDELTVMLPPHWPLRINLYTSVYIKGVTCQADEDGKLDLLGAMLPLLSYLKKFAAVSLTLDAYELGSIKLAHHRMPVPVEVKARISELWAKFYVRKDQLLADTESLTQYWLFPLFEASGGQLQLMPDKDLLDVPNSRCLFQWISCEWEEDTVLAQHIPVLLVTAGTDDALASDGNLREACNKLLKAKNQKRMLVTDGLRFAELKKNAHSDLYWIDISSIQDDLNQTKYWLSVLEGGA